MGNTGDEAADDGSEKHASNGGSGGDGTRRRIFKVPDPSGGMSLGRMEEIEKARASGHPIELTLEEQASYDAAARRLKSVLDDIKSPAVASALKLVEAQMPHIAGALELSAQVKEQLNDPSLRSTIESAKNALEAQAGARDRPETIDTGAIVGEASQSSIAAQQTETMFSILAENRKANEAHGKHLEAQEKQLAELVKLNEQSAQGAADATRTARTARTVGIWGLFLAFLAIVVSILIPVFQGLAVSNRLPLLGKTSAIESPSPSAAASPTPMAATPTVTPLSSR